MSRTGTGRRTRWAMALQLVPWAIAALLLLYLARQVPLAETLAALRGADLTRLLPTSIACIVAWFWLDSWGLSYVCSRFNAPFPPREARSVRALTYLLALVNWNLATGGILLHLRQAKRVPFFEGLSSLFFYNLMDGLILSSLVVIGTSLLAPSPALRSIQGVAGLLVVLQLGTLALFLSGHQPRWRPARRLMELGIFRSLRRAALRDVLLLLGLRIVYFVGFLIFFAVALSAFGADVPFAHLAATVPAILLVGVLPITPAGLGTQQAAVVYFYRAYAAEAELLAVGLLLPVVFVLFRAPVALFYLRDLPTLRAEIAAARRADAAP